MNIEKTSKVLSDIVKLDSQITLLYMLIGKHGEKSEFLKEEIHELETKRINKLKTLKSFVS